MKKFLGSIVNNWRVGVVTGIGLMTGVGGVVYVMQTPLRSDTINQTADVASEALGDIRLRQQAIVLSKEVVSNILKNEESLQLVQDLLSRLLQKPETRNSVMMLLRGVFDDPYMQESTKKFVVGILTDQWIQERLIQITRDLAKDLLKDEATRGHMVEFLKATALTTLEVPEVKERAIAKGKSVVWNVFTPWR